MNLLFPTIQDGRTALHHAACLPDLSCLLLLLEAGVDVEAEDQACEPLKHLLSDTNLTNTSLRVLSFTNIYA